MAIFSEWLNLPALADDLDPQIGIYRDAENGPCEICMIKKENWKERVIDEVRL